MSADLYLRCRSQRGDFCLDMDLVLPGTGVSVLYGPSGAGKTSVLRIIAGLDRVQGGYLSVAGEVWQDAEQNIFVPAHRRSVGYVPQGPSLFPHLNVRANIEYGWHRSGRPASPGLAAIADLLGIQHLLQRDTEALSGGEIQRVAIARALLMQPRVLLLDEPLSALDAARKAEVLPYLESLHDQLSMPVIYVSHAMEEVARIADSLVLVEDGRVRAQGPLEEMCARTDLASSFNDDPAVVFDARLAAHDDPDHLSQLSFAGGELWVSRRSEATGASLRCRIRARDVSLARNAPEASSVLNVLKARVTEVNASQQDASQMLVKLDAGGTILLSQITRRSCRRLQLVPGCEVWAQVKSAALLGAG